MKRLDVGSSPTRDADLEGSEGIRVLVVDDEHTIREGCSSILQEHGFDMTVSGRGEEARELLSREHFGIVLLDLYMRGVPGPELLRTCLERSPDTLVIMMTGNPSVESSLESLRGGAWDYLVKPFSATQLQILVGRAVHAVTVAHETASLRRESPDWGDTAPVLGESPAFRRVMEEARRVAPTDASVFITGESGTGKELIAQFVHQHSRRSSRSLVPVNCAALPDSLLESEIFGHAKGAFTGATSERIGLMEQAHGGTLFLDELAEMAPAMQAKLLRVIQDGVVRRVGSSTTDAVVDVRFTAATNRDPREAMEQGDLRRDLYYRLRVVPIHIPPLRERASDIPLLADHFLSYFWNRHRDPGEPAPVLGDAAARELQSRPWYGNVRELRNVMEHAVLLVEPGTEVRAAELPHLDEDGPAAQAGMELLAGYQGTDFHTARDRLMSEFEKRYVISLVERADGNMTEAARKAGVDRKTLFRLRRKHGLDASGTPPDLGHAAG